MSGILKAIKYLSSTQINMYFKCQFAYFLRYIHNPPIKKPPGIAAIVGRSVDKPVTADLQSKMDKGVLLSQEEIEDTARDIFNQEWDKGVLLTKEELESNDTKGKNLDKSVKLAGLHHEIVAPKIKPIRLQKRWELEISGFPFALVGIPDIEEKNSIRDTKTSSKTITQNIADLSLQLTIYSLGRKTIYKDNPELYLDCLIALKTPKTFPLKTIRSQKDYEKLFRRMEIMAEGLEKEIFMPCNQELNYYCDPRYCGYYGIECKYT